MFYYLFYEVLFRQYEQTYPALKALNVFRYVTFRTAYMAEDRAGLERSLRAHTARFREDFARHFPEGARAERRVWEEVEAWE